MSRFDVTSIGETLIGLSAYPGTRLEDADQLTVHTGGAETNVLAALCRLGHRCGWIGGLAENDLGRRVANDLRRAGIDISSAFRCSSLRMGVYYIEHAAGPLVTRVVYDRDASCASSIRPDMVDWDTLFDTRFVHLTGVTPALSPSALATVQDVVRDAGAEGVKISFDVNYRAKLWTADQAARTLEPLIENVDLLICSHRDAVLLFGCDRDPYLAVRQLADRTTADHVVLTRGDQGAMATDGSSMFEEAVLPVVPVDRLGAGDAFAAGVLHGVLNDDIQRGLSYGTVLASLALGQKGDMVTTNLDEVARLSNVLSTTGEVDR
ncbi:MAG: 2-dehydro-3-deoxygluconokinase [Acidimicrobiia bacterium]|nr:MAG: 2-dehydro-3-deoxygluconokinase [Acidimicrobiia bacterium]